MMIRNARCRGNALPETALIISTVLLIFFGTVKLALTSYEQAETYGAPVIAAHTASLATDSTNQSRGESRARGIFTHVPSNQIAVTPPNIG